MKYNKQLETYFHSNANKALQSPASNKQMTIQAIVNHKYFDIFIYSIIIFNVIVIIIDLIEPDSLLKLFNDICMIIFIIEFVIKHYAFGFYGYWRDNYNSFDGSLVLMIFLELALTETAVISAVRGLRFIKVIRAVRAIRIFRLLKSIDQNKQNKATNNQVKIDKIHQHVQIVKKEDVELNEITNKEQVQEKVNNDDDEQVTTNDEKKIESVNEETVKRRRRRRR